jgi:hypothetical protein
VFIAAFSRSARAGRTMGDMSTLFWLAPASAQIVRDQEVREMRRSDKTVKFLNIDFCQPEHPFECTGLQFIMVRDNGSHFPGTGYFKEPYVAPGTPRD